MSLQINAKFVEWLEKKNKIQPVNEGALEEVIWLLCFVCMYVCMYGWMYLAESQASLKPFC